MSPITPLLPLHVLLHLLLLLLLPDGGGGGGGSEVTATTEKVLRNMGQVDKVPPPGVIRKHDLTAGDGVDGSLISNRGLRSQEPQMFAERSHTESQIRKALPQDFLSSYGRKWLRLLETSAPRSSQFVREFGLFPSQLFLTWLADERNWGNFDSSAVTSRSRTEVSRQSHYLNAFNSWLKQSKWKNPFLSAVTRSSRREGSRNLLPYFSFDSWFSVFQETFKRDMILNVGKVGGIILLYYLAPDLLSWINNTFGQG